MSDEAKNQGTPEDSPKCPVTSGASAQCLECGAWSPCTAGRRSSDDQAAKHVERLVELVIWMTGSADFAPEGVAAKGWAMQRHVLDDAIRWLGLGTNSAPLGTSLNPTEEARNDPDAWLGPDPKERFVASMPVRPTSATAVVGTDVTPVGGPWEGCPGTIAYIDVPRARVLVTGRAYDGLSWVSLADLPARATSEATPAAPVGTTHCPICGEATPHAHGQKDVESWATNQVARWGYVVRLSSLDAVAARAKALVKKLEDDSTYDRYGYARVSEREGERIVALLRELSPDYATAVIEAARDWLAEYDHPMGLGEESSPIARLRKALADHAYGTRNDSTPKRSDPHECDYPDGNVGIDCHFGDLWTCPDCGDVWATVNHPKAGPMRVRTNLRTDSGPDTDSGKVSR